jgi:nucleotide-binding universal stress UspA family protein
MVKPTRRRLLVPVDFSSASERVVAFARALASAGDELMLLHAIPAPDLDTLTGLPPVSRWETQRLAYQAADGAIRDLAARVDWPDATKVSTHVGQGEAAAEIALQAIALNADLIVMATHGRGAAGRLAFGSVADSVARHAPVPVLLVRAVAGVDLGEPARLARIVVPVDGSAASAEAVPVAAVLAKQFAVPVMLVTVRQLNPTALMPSPVSPGISYDPHFTKTDEELTEMLRRTAAPLEAERVEVLWQILVGPVAPAIADQVQPDDLVVMASHGRRGVQRWLLGSVAEHLVRHAAAPVLLVPPRECVLSALEGETDEGRK